MLSGGPQKPQDAGDEGAGNDEDDGERDRPRDRAFRNEVPAALVAAGRILGKRCPAVGAESFGHASVSRE